MMPELQRRKIMMIVACLILIAMGLLFSACSGSGANEGGGSTDSRTETRGKDEHADKHGSGGASEVKLSEEALKAAKIETVEVSEQSPDETLRVTGSVETNQQQTQQVTPLAEDRVNGSTSRSAIASAPERRSSSFQARRSRRCMASCTKVFYRCKR